MPRPAGPNFAHPPLTVVQLSYYTLRALAQWLAPRLAGARLTACFSQTRDELIVGFEGPGRGGELYLRLGCRPELPYLVPVQGFKRQRQNVAEVFPALVGQVVAEVFLTPGERLLQVVFASGERLLFKLHGNRTNALYWGQGAVKARFRHTLRDDAQFTLPPGTPELPDDTALQQAFDTGGLPELLRRVPTFGGEPTHYLVDLVHEQGLAPLAALHRVYAELCAGRYYVTPTTEGAMLSLLGFAYLAGQVYTDIGEALADWLRAHLGRADTARQHTALELLLTQALGRTQRALHSVETSLAHLGQQRSYEELGHLLMAHLDRIAPGAASVTLPDFYHADQPITLPLEPTQSAQENAAALYARHREQQRRRAHLAAQQSALTEEVAELEALKRELAGLANDRKALAAFAASHTARLTPRPDTGPEAEASLPYHRLLALGYEIRIGKDAARNDALTFGHSHKDDLWLHVKDTPGAHVIVRRVPGQGFSRDVIELAAGLAAWHSKRRTEGLVPVAYTPRKYVRKTRHLLPGQVRVEREQTVLVSPVDPARL